MGFPDADVFHLETCIEFFLWAFSVSCHPHVRRRFMITNRYIIMLHGSCWQFDDLSDEGDLQSDPEAHQVGVTMCMEVLQDPTAPRPKFPYAAMLHE